MSKYSCSTKSVGSTGTHMAYNAVTTEHCFENNAGMKGLKAFTVVFQHCSKSKLTLSVPWATKVTEISNKW